MWVLWLVHTNAIRLSSSVEWSQMAVLHVSLSPMTVASPWSRQTTRHACWQINLLRRISTISTTCIAACSALYLWALVAGRYGTTTSSDQTAISCSVITVSFCLVICMGIVRDSLVWFERNSVSSYFYKVLEAHDVGFRDIIPPSQVLHGICLIFTAPFLRGMLLLDCTFYYFYTFSRLLHVPVRLIKEVVRADGLWWTGWSCRVYKCIVKYYLRHVDGNLYRVGLLFLGCNAVQSGSLGPTFLKQEVHSKLMNQLLSKQSNNLYNTTYNKTVSFIASAVRTKKATSVCVHNH
jgi:hypothetical protein